MSEILVLNDYEHVRTRTEMYLGSRKIVSQNILVYNKNTNNFEIKEVVYVPAVLTSFREALDNAIDATIKTKIGNRIDIYYDEKESIFTIKDYSKGISIEYNNEYKLHDVTLALTKLRTGSNFIDSNRNGAGMNGLGISCVVNVSEYFNVIVRRNNKEFKQNYKANKSNLVVDDPIITDINTKNELWKHGTEVSFKLDSKIFDNRTLPEELVYTLLKQISINNKNIEFYYNNEKITNSNIFNENNSIKIDIITNNFYSTFYLVNNFIKNTDFNDYFNYSLTNNIPLFNGGSHIDTFNSLFFSGLINELKIFWKKEKIGNISIEPKKCDIQKGMLIYNETKMIAPYFDSQSKTRLINEETNKYIKDFFSNFNWKKFIKNNENFINSIKSNTIERMEMQGLKELKKKQKKVLKKNIDKLFDANSKNRMECELFLCEGDSAAAGGLNVRDPKTQAFISLGGKIPNVYDMSPLQVHESIKINNILGAIGLSIGEKIDRKNLRYKHVYIATDMDTDGSYIAAEIVNLFHKYWPYLLTDNDPFLRIFMTPFIIAEKGMKKKYWFLDTIKEFSNFNSDGWHITRAKGLGTLEKDDWEYVINNPRYIEVTDKGSMNNILRLIFKGGHDAANDRKKWMTSSWESIENANKSNWKF